LDEHNTRIYNQITVEVKGIYNPRATSYNIIPGGVVPLPGNLPAETEDAIRNVLTTPRGLFIYQDETNNIVIRSPSATPVAVPVFGVPLAINSVCDADNGPEPAVVDVKEVHGMKSWEVTMSVTTCITDCTSNNPLLSHEWRTFIALDEDYWTTLITEGRAVFDPNVLRVSSLSADDFRRFLIPLPPFKYKRMALQVELEADGKTLAWKVTEQVKRVDLLAAGITDIEVSQSFGRRATFPLHAIMHVATSMAGRQYRAVGRARAAARAQGRTDAQYQQINAGQAASGQPAYAVPVHASNVENDVTAHTEGLVGTFAGSLPTAYKNIVIRVTGTPQTRIGVLQDTAYQVAVFRLSTGASLSISDLFGSDVIIDETHDPSDGVLELKITLGTGIPGQAVLFNPLAGLASLGASIGVLPPGPPVPPVPLIQILLDVFGAVGTAENAVHLGTLSATDSGLGPAPRPALFPFLGNNRTGGGVAPGVAPLAGASMPASLNGTTQDLLTAIAQALQGSCQKPLAPVTSRFGVVGQALTNPNS
jgi:hypothetical protein